MPEQPPDHAPDQDQDPDLVPAPNRILTRYQANYILDTARFKGLLKSRRIGGSYSVTLDSVMGAIGFDPVTGGLDPATGKNEFLISASQHQAEEMVRECRAHIENLERHFSIVQEMAPLARRHGLPCTPDVLYSMYAARVASAGTTPTKPRALGQRKVARVVAKKSARISLVSDVRSDRLTLTNGCRIEARPANPDTVRGVTGNLTFDEFGVMPHSHLIWAAAKPIMDANLGRRQGLKLRVTGTPLGDDNMFYRLARTCQNCGAPNKWEGRGRCASCGDLNRFSWHNVDIYRAVKDGFPADPAELLREIGDRDMFLQEYCCEFLSSSSRYIPSELIDDRMYDAGDPDFRRLFEKTQDRSAYGGLDVARSPTGDYSALVVVYKIGDTYYVRPEVWAERGASFATQKDRVRTELSRGVRRVCIDSTGVGTDMAEALAKELGKSRIEGVNFGNAVKEDLATRVRRLLEEGRLRLPRGEQDLIRDLLSMKRLITSSGNTRFDIERSGKNGHGDRAWALALALHAAENGPAPFKPVLSWIQPALIQPAPRQTAGWGGRR